jgi:hypothetical protein
LATAWKSSPEAKASLPTVRSDLLDEAEMADETARFISLATRAVANPEREAAGHELAARIAHAGGEGEVASAAGRLANAMPPPAWRLPVLACVVLAGLIAALVFLIPSHWNEARLLAPIHHQGFNGKYYERLLATLGPAAEDVPLRTIYYTDQAAWAREVDALLKEAPDDPAYYRFYSRWFSYLHPTEVLPPDYRSRWQALDPDNALWGISAANQLAEKSISSSRGVHTVTDETRFQQALGYFSEAASSDFCRSRAAVVQDRQLRSFRRDDSLESVYIGHQLVQLAGDDPVVLYSILRAVEVQADRLEVAGDKERLEGLMKDLRKVVTMILDDPSHGYMSISIMRSMALRLAAKCRAIGLSGEAEWLERVHDVDTRLRAARSSSGAERLSSSYTRPWTSGDPLDIKPEDLKPGRLAEYAVADRFVAVIGVLVFMLIGGGCLVEILRRRSVNGMARGLIPLWRSSDSVWLIGVGVLFPLLWWFGIVHGSRLGCRDIGLTYFSQSHYPLMQPWLSQDLGGLLFAAVMIFQVARWRWAKRGGFLAMRPNRMWIGWTIAVVAALFIPVQGIVRYLPAHQQKFLLFGSAAGGIPLLWLLWQAAVIVFLSRDNALGVQLLVRSILPAAMTAAILLLAAVPVLRKAERTWVANDELIRRDPEGSGMSIVERRANEPLRRAMREALR